jgi:anti-sigma factor RsiW
MAKMAPMSEEERAELVAYLDGELPKPAAQALEAKLNTDPRLRAEVDTLRSTWEMLDYLSKPEPSANFTSRTLDRVSAIRPVSRASRVSRASAVSRASVVSYAPGARQRWRPWAFGVGWAAAVLVAAVIGYGGGQWLGSRTRQSEPRDAIDVQPQLVKDFRVIENRRLYENADDMSFLKALLDPELFGEDN